VDSADDDWGVGRRVFHLPELVRGGDGLALNRPQPIAGLKARHRGRRVWHDRGDLARVVVELRQAETGEHEHGDHEVGRGAGG